jgi:hypothetical protein
MNVRLEEGFKRIIEVVVLESIRQGYHTIGAIVWTTFLDKDDALDALAKLIEKGLIIKHKKAQLFSKVDYYDLVPGMAKKVGVKQRSILGISQKKLPVLVKDLKEISQSIQTIKSSIEDEDMEKTIENFDLFIDPTKHGQQMIEQFFEEHREIRLWKIRLKDRGVDYLKEHKQIMLDTFDNVEATITQKLRYEVARTKS